MTCSRAQFARGRDKRIVKRIGIELLALLIPFLVACAHGRSGTPSIEITRVPIADPGGPEKMEFIEGRVSNGEPSQKVVLYAQSGGIWWVQPFADQPLTNIQADATWKNSTHLGMEYAALLVKPGYHPVPRLRTLPSPDGTITAVAVKAGAPGSPAPPAPKTIHFSGYDWAVRVSGSNRGGEPLSYDPENVRVDSKGYLHLRMGERNGRWYCAELYLTRALGLGTYRFVVEDSARLPPSAVVGLFTFDDQALEDVRNELDVELSQWGNANGKNAQYVVQPFYVPENVVRFNVPAGILTHEFRWLSGSASFRSVRGPSTKGTPIAQHEFTSGIPSAAGQTVHIDLYDYHHSQSGLRNPVEVVIEKFDYLP
jgi:hypothetical protein